MRTYVTFGGGLVTYRYRRGLQEVCRQEGLSGRLHIGADFVQLFAFFRADLV